MPRGVTGNTTDSESVVLGPNPGEAALLLVHSDRR